MSMSAFQKIYIIVACVAIHVVVACHVSHHSYCLSVRGGVCGRVPGCHFSSEPLVTALCWMLVVQL